MYAVRCLAISMVLGLVAACLPTPTASADPQVWTGLTKTFTKPDYADWTLPEFQDQITPNVALTRADTEGMFNIVHEAHFTHFSSPSGTLWATALLPGNGAELISAANYANLTFSDWESAYGAGGNLGFNIVNYDAVVHLIEDEIYLDLRFTDWTRQGGGGFSYLRAEVPEPSALVLFASTIATSAVRRRARCAAR